MGDIYTRLANLLVARACVEFNMLATVCHMARARAHMLNICNLHETWLYETLLTCNMFLM